MSDQLVELFSSKVRAAVLTYLLPRSHLGLSLTELSRRLDLPISSLQHECYKLERIGLLDSRREGNARRYRVEPTWPLLTPLTTLVIAAIGQTAALRAATDGLDGLELAFLADATPPETETRLVLVGEMPLEALDGALGRVESILAVPPGTVELAFFRPDDWRARVTQRNPYVAELLAGARLDLV